MCNERSLRLELKGLALLTILMSNVNDEVFARNTCKDDFAVRYSGRLMLG